MSTSDEATIERAQESRARERLASRAGDRGRTTDRNSSAAPAQGSQEQLRSDNHVQRRTNVQRSEEQPCERREMQVIVLPKVGGEENETSERLWGAENERGARVWGVGCDSAGENF